MTRIATRELRNDTAGVLRRVQAGEEVVITVRGEPVAQIVPLTAQGRRWMPRDEVLEILRTAQADPALSKELRELAGGPDDLDPIV
ncbi:type II toxin-antitoxin system prevent-host-death family antitoxin [uncultured Arthrobacter sp.]|uniref:type II toxin-antitoxin system Phd/YefM family antitoxin n=1 Tax=uncultured Arthrobacter sp. TaxID=114050 RepID=UPI0032164B2B